MSRRPRLRAVVLLSGGDLGWMESRNIAVLGFNTGAYLSSFTHDHYLPAKAARALFGPDGARRQRHAIEARDHTSATRVPRCTTPSKLQFNGSKDWRCRQIPLDLRFRRA